MVIVWVPTVMVVAGLDSSALGVEFERHRWDFVVFAGAVVLDSPTRRRSASGVGQVASFGLQALPEAACCLATG